MSDGKILLLHNDQFNGAKLQIARERAMISRAQLAESVGASPSFITACEKGRKKPSTELEILLAHHLGVLPNFFHGPVQGRWNVEDCHFRHRQAATEIIKGRLRAQLYVYSDLVSTLERIVRFPDVRIPHVALDETCSVELVARELRLSWGIGTNTPIGHLCRLIENAGVVIGYHTVEAETVDACSHLGGRPIILITKTGRGTSRLQYDLGHELGELIFHETADPSAEYEKRINSFVSAFLMPADGFAPHFSVRPLTLSHLWELKRTWRTSASAILQRALQLELLTYETFVMWKRKLAARGWSKSEPQELEFTEPESLRRAIGVAVEHGVSFRDLAEHVNLKEHALSELLRPYWSPDDPSNPLNLSKSGRNVTGELNFRVL